MNEHPTEPGWYWFKESPDGPWKPAEVVTQKYTDNALFRFQSEELEFVESTWPQQWGSKIQEME